MNKPPGFKAVTKQIANKQNISNEQASTSVKKKNPNLRKVK